MHAAGNGAAGSSRMDLLLQTDTRCAGLLTICPCQAALYAAPTLDGPGNENADTSRLYTSICLAAVSTTACQVNYTGGR